MIFLNLLCFCILKEPFYHDIIYQEIEILLKTVKTNVNIGMFDTKGGEPRYEWIFTPEV